MAGAWLALAAFFVAVEAAPKGQVAALASGAVGIFAALCALVVVQVADLTADAVVIFGTTSDAGAVALAADEAGVAVAVLGTFVASLGGEVAFCLLCTGVGGVAIAISEALDTAVGGGVTTRDEGVATEIGVAWAGGSGQTGDACILGRAVARKPTSGAFGVVIVDVGAAIGAGVGVGIAEFSGVGAFGVLFALDAFFE